MITGKIVVVNQSDIDWSEILTERIGRPFHVKNLFDEPETGMNVTLLRYPAGLINPHHTHPCGHGIYVLEGKLVTHRGEFGPDHLGKSRDRTYRARRGAVDRR